METFRTTMIALGLLLASGAAFADPAAGEEKGAAEPQTPREESSAKSPPATPSPTPPEIAPPPSTPAQPPPTIGTTQTTSAYAEGSGGVAVPLEPPRPPIGDRLSIEPLMGFGSNDYNFGIGARMGYTFTVPFYIGGTLMWHYGADRDFIGPLGFTETWNTFSYPAGEIGYDVAIGYDASVVVRPYAGAGALFRYERALLNGFFFASDVDTEFLVYPGITAHYRIPHSSVYVGVDTRLLVPVATTDLSYQAFGVIGINP